MARVLVTGAAGFIGSTLTERLLDSGYEVIGIDSFTDYYDIAVKKNNLAKALGNKMFSLIDKDILEIDIKSLGKFDYVFHLAAQPGVRASWGRMFETYIKNNIAATQKLLEELKSSRITKFVYSSSSSVYGNKSGIMSEVNLPSPHSPYGATKLAAEHLCNIYNRNYGLPTVSLRYFTVYGPRQRPDMAFTRFVAAALTGRQITVFGDGNQTRDFTYIDDVVNATIKSAESDVVGEVMNIGGGHIVSINYVLDMLHGISSKKINVEYKQKQLGDVDHTEADTTKARKLIGFSPKVQVHEGLSREFQYVKDNLQLYSTIL